MEYWGVSKVQGNGVVGFPCDRYGFVAVVTLTLSVYISVPCFEPVRILIKSAH